MRNLASFFSVNKNKVLALTFSSPHPISLHLTPPPPCTRPPPEPPISKSELPKGALRARSHQETKEEAETPQVFMRRKNQDNICANAMWILENRRVDRGGGVKFFTPYRLRHLPSSTYLTVADGPKGLRLQLSDSRSPVNIKEALFVLHPLDLDTAVPTSQTPFHLKHQATGLYIKRPQMTLQVWLGQRRDLKRDEA